MCSLVLTRGLAHAPAQNDGGLTPQIHRVTPGTHLEPAAYHDEFVCIYPRPPQRHPRIRPTRYLSTPADSATRPCASQTPYPFLSFAAPHRSDDHCTPNAWPQGHITPQLPESSTDIIPYLSYADARRSPPLVTYSKRLVSDPISVTPISSQTLACVARIVLRTHSITCNFLSCSLIRLAYTALIDWFSCVHNVIAFHH